MMAGVQWSLTKQAHILHDLGQLSHKLLILCHFHIEITSKIFDQRNLSHLFPQLWGRNILVERELVVDWEKAIANNPWGVSNLANLQLSRNIDEVEIVDHWLVNFHDPVQFASVHDFLHILVHRQDLEFGCGLLVGFNFLCILKRLDLLFVAWQDLGGGIRLFYLLLLLV